MGLPVGQLGHQAFNPLAVLNLLGYFHPVKKDTRHLIVLVSIRLVDKIHKDFFKAIATFAGQHYPGFVAGIGLAGLVDLV